MKKIIITSVFAVLASVMTIVMAQNSQEEYLGLPGDNLNLYAVMKLFQESETLEGFERALNDENSRINNLDLNRDNYVDYITVSDYVDGNVHTIVLRAILGQNEYQDVAVFTVHKFNNGRVQIQLIGDEALYGKNYIIEPYYAETPNPGYIGRPVKKTSPTVVTTTYYNVVHWPVIRFIYTPNYVVWRSNWYWGFYPVYWTSWRPYYWHYYYGYHYNWQPVYYKSYRHYGHVRSVSYNTVYYSKIRVYSPVVIVNVNKGYYKTTYSKPEQRRDGEALYSQLHPNQVNIVSGTTSVRNEPRRSPESAAAGNSSATNVTTAERRTRTESGVKTGNSGQKAGETVNPAVRTNESGTKAVRTTDGTLKSAPAGTTRTVNRSSAERTANDNRTRSATTTSRTTTDQKTAPAERTRVQNSSESKPTAIKKSASSETINTQRQVTNRSNTIKNSEVSRTPASTSRTPAVKNTQPSKTTTEQRTAVKVTSPRQSGTAATSSEKKSSAGRTITGKNDNAIKSETKRSTTRR